MSDREELNHEKQQQYELYKYECELANIKYKNFEDWLDWEYRTVIWDITKKRHEESGTL
jgi:hypothetical protein